jgi:hypothetical protein
VRGLSDLHCTNLTFCPAAQNETALKNLFYGQILNNLIPLIARLVYRFLGHPLSIRATVLSLMSLGLSQFLYTRLAKMGKSRRDATGALVSAGNDLNQAGVTEWMFDVLYISCASRCPFPVVNSLIAVAGAAQVGSATLSEWVWWIYAAVRRCVPVYSPNLRRVLPDTCFCCIQALGIHRSIHWHALDAAAGRGGALGAAEQAAGKAQEEERPRGPTGQDTESSHVEYARWNISPRHF